MNAKPWYQSTTYYALAVAIATKIFMLAGLAESDAGKQAGELVTVLLPFIGILADLVAAWGRKRAQGPVTLTKAAAEAQSKQSGFARPSLLVLLVISVLAGCVLVGCQSNPAGAIQAACDKSHANYQLERCAKSIGETWEVYQVRAEDLVADPLAPADVKRAAQRAEATARPVIVQLLKATAFYSRVKAEVAAGTTEEEKLAIANANMERYVQQALPLIASMRQAVGL